MFKKTKSVAVGTAKVVASVTIPGVAGAIAGKEKYDECKLNGDSSVKTALKVSGAAIKSQTLYCTGTAILSGSMS